MPALSQFQERIATENVDLQGLKKFRNDKAFIQKPLQSKSTNALIESIDYYV